MAGKTDRTCSADAQAGGAEKAGATSTKANQAAWKQQNRKGGDAAQAEKKHQGRSGPKSGSGRKD